MTRENEVRVLMDVHSHEELAKQLLVIGDVLGVGVSYGQDMDNNKFIRDIVTSIHHYRKKSGELQELKTAMRDIISRLE